MKQLPSLSLPSTSFGLVGNEMFSFGARRLFSSTGKTIPLPQVGTTSGVAGGDDEEGQKVSEQPKVPKPAQGLDSAGRQAQPSVSFFVFHSLRSLFILLSSFAAGHDLHVQDLQYTERKDL